MIRKVTLSFNIALILLAALIASLAFIQASKITSQDFTPQVMTWKIGDTIRQALVYIPATAKQKLAPLVFDFHGHGGTMRAVYNSHAFEKLWPEAIYVCPQGLNTPGSLTDPEGKRAGWQSKKTNMGDRDLKFFDAMLTTLQNEYKVDSKRIYSTGHSNGGGFTYLLWALRGDVFAAVASSSSAAAGLTGLLKPKPAMHLMGETDPLVKPEWQNLTINLILKLNQCEKQGKEIGKYTKYYASKSGNPVVVFVHPGGHVYAEGENVAIANFFKEQVKK